MRGPAAVTLPPVMVIVRFGAVVQFSVEPVVPVVATNVASSTANEPVPAAEAMVKVSPTPSPCAAAVVRETAPVPVVYVPLEIVVARPAYETDEIRPMNGPVTVYAD